MTKPKILISDDEPFNVDYLEQELEDLDYDTASAFDGWEALAQVERLTTATEAVEQGTFDPDGLSDNAKCQS